MVEKEEQTPPLGQRLGPGRRKLEKKRRSNLLNCWGKENVSL